MSKKHVMKEWNWDTIGLRLTALGSEWRCECWWEEQFFHVSFVSTPKCKGTVLRWMWALCITTCKTNVKSCLYSKVYPMDREELETSMTTVNISQQKNLEQHGRRGE